MVCFAPCHSSWFIYARMWGHGVCQLQPGLSRSIIHHLTGSRSHCLAVSPLPRLPISAPPTSLDECFFFIFLVLGLSYSSIFCQSWLFFVFKLLLSFFWLCEEAQCVYLCLHLGWKSTLGIFHLFFHLGPILCLPILAATLYLFLCIR